MGLQSTDLFIVERAGVQYHMTADMIAEFVGAVKDYTATDFAGLIGETYAGATDVKEGDRVFVTDASGDTTVDFGWAVYRYNGTGYDKVQEQESMDLIVTTAANLTIAVDAVSAVISNDNGTGVTIPLVDDTNAGLASPAMFNNIHVETTSGLTSASNPIVVDVANQILTFAISPLTPLP